MNQYAIIRRNGWRSPEELGEAAERSTRVGDEQMPNDIRWIRSYVLDEGNRCRRHPLHLRGHQPGGDP